MTGPDFAALIRTEAANLERQYRQQHAERVNAIPFDSRLWLAVTPAWTVPLAEAVGFPCTDRGLEATIVALRDVGLCETATDPWRLDVTAQQRFWMPRGARGEVLTDAFRAASPSARDVAAVIGDIGSRIAAASIAPEEIPPIVRRWAELARQSPDLEAVGQALEARVDQCLGPHAPPGSTSAERRPAEALDWIDAARLLGDMLGVALAATVRQQGRRVDLVYRQHEDERHLRTFLLRAEPFAAFEALLAAPDDRWALHFIGPGGVGKTILLRYITSRWASERAAVTARVDFDHINPDFPSRAPALLLAHLMQDLRLHANASVDRTFASFESKMLALHERAAAALAPDAAVGTQVPELQIVIDVFAEAVRMLPRPIVVLLDTCEELAKARFASVGLPDNVQATMQLLEALHERVPWLRVVFCGRRPLSGSGAGWILPGCNYPPRDYLMLHELRGFTHGEAVRYLTTVLDVRPGLVDPIITSSRDTGETMGFVRTEAARSTDAVREEDRYLPFSLSLYGRWAREDEDLTPDAILRGDVDPYIEHRVVGRVRRAALLELIPAIALLGRFDLDLLRAMSTRQGAEFEEALRELREQEWVVQQENDFFEVKAHLRWRLRAYLERSGRTVVSATAARALDHLIRLTSDAPFPRLALSHFEATVRLLTRDPVLAFDWWDRIEQRFANTGELGWARQLCELLLSDEGPAAASSEGTSHHEHPLRPAILATYAALLEQANELTLLDTIWQEVDVKRAYHPRAEGAERLRLRARAGRIRAQLKAGTDDATFADLVEAFMTSVQQVAAERMDERVASASLGAFEALIEMVEARHAPWSKSWAGALNRFVEALRRTGNADEITTIGLVLAARSAQIHDDIDRAEAYWDASLEASDCLGAPTRQRWLEWRSPEDVPARVRLEYARLAYPAIHPAKPVLAKVGDQIRPPASIDADRLDSAILRLRSAERTPLTQDVATWVEEGQQPWPGGERCNAHRELVPLAAAFWEIEALAYGQVDAAMDALRAQVDVAEQSASDLTSVETFERSRLAIARRMRLRDEERVANAPRLIDGEPDHVASIHALAAFDSESRVEDRLPVHWPPSGGNPPGEAAVWLHVYWRSIPVVSEHAAHFALDWMARMPFAEAIRGDSYAALACRLDVLEAYQIARRYRLAGPSFDPELDPENLETTSRRIRQWVTAHPLETQSHLRLTLRAGAAGQAGRRRSPAVKHALELCGHRTAAAVALDEGELLALRLPSAALLVIEPATRWFLKGGDPVGAFVTAGARALAAARAPDRKALTGALRDGEQAYREILGGLSEGRNRKIRVRSVLSLPSWDQLKALAKRPRPRSLEMLTPDGWRPWLVRLVAAMSWVHDGHRHGERSAVIGQWLSTAYGTSHHDHPEQVVLPPELEPWTPRTQGRPPQTRTRLPLPSPSATSGQPVRMRIESHISRQAPAGADVPVTIHATLPPSAASSGPEVELVGALLVRDRYRVAIQQGFSHGAQRLGREFELAGRPRLVELTVDRDLAAGCWEGLLSSLLSPWDRVGEPPEFIRRASTVRGGWRTPTPWPDSSVVLSLLGDFLLSRAVHDGWRVVEEDPRSTVTVETITSLWKVTGGKRDPDVLHLIGTPVETGHGDVALQIARTALAGESILRPSSSPARGGELIRPHDLRRRFPSAVLMVLQAPPTAGRERNASDQECASLLRMLAADLAASSLPGVLTIPPLPVEEAVKCLVHLGRAVVRRDAPIEPALREAVFRCRHIVRSGSLVSAEDREEAAADLCLYLLEDQP